MSTNYGNRVMIHKNGEEGGFHIDAMTGAILTPSNERPDWADGLATAMLAERVGHYERALGHHLPETMRTPQAINYADLSWVGVDAEGDEVEIEASQDFRSEVISTILEIDTSVEGWEKLMENAIAGHEADYTYMTQPTDEQTLAEAEGKDFSEAAKKAVEG